MGFETNPVEPNKDPHAAWVICDGIPVCVATDKIHPCTAAELLAFHYMNGETMPPVVSQKQSQQSFLDERDQHRNKQRRDDRRDESPKDSGGTASSSAAAPVQNDTMMEELELPDVPHFPFEGSTAKELRAQSPDRATAPLTQAPKSPSKRESSPSLVSSLKKNKVTGKGIEMPRR